MNKSEFIVELRKKLSSLSENELEERLEFYGEMVDDRVEDGLTEEEAVLAIGSIDDVVAEMVSETSFKNYDLTKTVEKPQKKQGAEKVKKKRRLKGWEIALLAIGSPLWISLLVAAFAILLAFYVVLWSLIISVWAIFISFAACGLAGLAAGVGLIIKGFLPVGIFVIGAGLVLLGLAIFIFFGSKASTKGAVKLSKNIVLGIGKSFRKKEEA